MVEQVWNEYDYDKNGVLDLAEASDFIGEIVKLMGDQRTVEGVMENIQRGKDGGFTKNDIIQWLNEFLN